MNRLLLLCAFSSVTLLSALGQDLSTWPSLSKADQLKIFSEKFTYSQGHEYFCSFMERGDPGFDFASFTKVKKAAIIAFNLNLDINSNVAGRTTFLGKSEQVDVTAINMIVDSMCNVLKQRLEGLGIELVPPTAVVACSPFQSLPSNDPWKLALYGEKWQCTHR